MAKRSASAARVPARTGAGERLRQGHHHGNAACGALGRSIGGAVYTQRGTVEIPSPLKQQRVLTHITASMRITRAAESASMKVSRFIVHRALMAGTLPPDVTRRAARELLTCQAGGSPPSAWTRIRRSPLAAAEGVPSLLAQLTPRLWKDHFADNPMTSDVSKELCPELSAICTWPAAWCGGMAAAAPVRQPV